MDYMKLKLAIYESYGNGELTSDACSHLIDHLDEKYGESIAEEAANAENGFINASLNVFTESAGEEALTEAAKNFGAKIKAAWEKFKAWIKKIIEKILSLGKKPEQQKTKIQVPKALDKALSDAKKWIAKLGGAKTIGAMAAAVAGIVASTALIIKNRKLKETVGAKIYEYEKFKKEQADLVKDMQDAALKAQEEIENLKARNTQLRNIGQDFADSNANLQTELDNAEKRLAAAEAKAKADVASLDRKNDDQKQTIGEQQIEIGDQKDEIEKLKKEVEDLKKQIAESKAKKAEASKQSEPSNTSSENVTDSKILSASTGLVNAVTQTVVALLPAASQTTITSDEIRNNPQTRDASIKAKLDNWKTSEMRTITTASRKCETYRLKLQNIIIAITLSLNKFRDMLDADRNARYGEYRHGDNGFEMMGYFRKKIDSSYGDEEKLVNDCINSTGPIMNMINKAINDCKSATDAVSKYMNINKDKLTESDKSKLNSMIKVYNDLEFAENQASDLSDVIDTYGYFK